MKNHSHFTRFLNGCNLRHYRSIYMGISAHNTVPESWVINSTNVPKAYGDCFTLNVITWEDTVYK